MPSTEITADALNRVLASPKLAEFGSVVFDNHHPTATSLIIIRHFHGNTSHLALNLRDDPTFLELYLRHQDEVAALIVTLAHGIPRTGLLMEHIPSHVGGLSEEFRASIREIEAMPRARLSTAIPLASLASTPAEVLRILEDGADNFDLTERLVEAGAPGVILPSWDRILGSFRACAALPSENLAHQSGMEPSSLFRNDDERFKSLCASIRHAQQSCTNLVLVIGASHTRSGRDVGQIDEVKIMLEEALPHELSELRLVVVEPHTLVSDYEMSVNDALRKAWDELPIKPPPVEPFL